MRVILTILLTVGLMYLPFGVSLTEENAGRPGLITQETPGATVAEKEYEAGNEDNYPYREIETYRNVIITATQPVIARTLTDYYGQDVSFNALNVKFLDAITPDGYGTFDYLVKIQVEPFNGENQNIGIDNITLRVKNGKVALYKFRHVKSIGVPFHSETAQKEL